MAAPLDVILSCIAQVGFLDLNFLSTCKHVRVFAPLALGTQVQRDLALLVPHTEYLRKMLEWCMLIFNTYGTNLHHADMFLTDGCWPSICPDRESMPAEIPAFQQLQRVWYECRDIVCFHYKCYRGLCRFYFLEDEPDVELRRALEVYTEALRCLVNWCSKRQGVRVDKTSLNATCFSIW